MVAAGTLRERAIIEQDGDTGWAEFGRAWGAFKLVDKGHSLDVERPKVQPDAELRIRYLPGVEPLMRLRVLRGAEDRYFEVLAADDRDGRRRDMRLLLRERPQTWRAYGR